MKAYLVLEDGTYFEGKFFGPHHQVFGEVVFNTSMTGYQEVLTDPSYKGQIVVMTYPLIGNYGYNKEDNESSEPHVQGFIAKEISDLSSNWRSEGTLEEFFFHHGITGLYDIDTRQLTRHIRHHGSMYGVITANIDDISGLVAEVKKKAGQTHDLVDSVTTKKIIHYEGPGPRIVVMDLGVKRNIIRSLISMGCDVYVVPAYTTDQSILSLCPDGVLFSNGPGDPRDVPYALDTVKSLIGKKPLLGICLGCQLLGLAFGGEIFKLKFGHHGSNHPVKDLVHNRVYITSQNHNYALKENFSPGIRITYMSLNDNTVEGFSHNHYPVLAIQYHPEASPGPLDSGYIFKEFLDLVTNGA